MQSVFRGVTSGIQSIFSNVGKSLQDDLFFPSRPSSLEDQINAKFKGQDKTIRALQQALAIRNAALRNAQGDLKEMHDLLKRKNEEVEKQRQKLKDFQLK